MTRELLAAMLVLVADQLSKGFVSRNETVRIWRLTGSWFQIRRVTNGLQNGGFWRYAAVGVVLWGVLFTVLVVVPGGRYLFRDPFAQIGLGAALGGATSNLFDRLRRGVIIDFIKIGWWPVFNLADAGITVGVIAALCFMGRT